MTVSPRLLKTNLELNIMYAQRTISVTSTAITQKRKVLHCLKRKPVQDLSSGHQALLDFCLLFIGEIPLYSTISFLS